MTREELDLITEMRADIKALQEEVAKLKKRQPAKRFEKPTLEELSEEFFRKGSNTCRDDAEAFYNHYESKGWVVGRTKMKSWKAAVANWMRGKKEKQKAIPGNQRSYTESTTIHQRVTDTSWADGL